MRQLGYAATCVLLLAFSAVRSAETTVPSQPVLPTPPLGVDVSDILGPAKNALDPSLPPPARAQSILILGTLKPTEAPKLLYLKDVFRYLLANPASLEYEKNYCRYYVVQAIGNAGPLMAELKTDVLRYMQIDSILTAQIVATAAQLDAKPAAADSTKPAPTTAISIPDTLKKLADTTATVADRSAAADSLVKALGVKGVAAKDVAAIMGGMLLATQDPAADSTTRILFANSASATLNAANTADAASNPQWQVAYIAALGTMLVAKNNSEIVAAANALGAIGKPVAAVTTVMNALQNAAKNTDAKVAKAATDAVAAITKQ